MARKHKYYYYTVIDYNIGTAVIGYPIVYIVLHLYSVKNSTIVFTWDPGSIQSVHKSSSPQTFLSITHFEYSKETPLFIFGFSASTVDPK